MFADRYADVPCHTLVSNSARRRGAQEEAEAQLQFTTRIDGRPLADQRDDQPTPSFGHRLKPRPLLNFELEIALPLLVVPSLSNSRAAVLVRCGHLSLVVETNDEPGSSQAFECLNAQLVGTQILITTTGAPLTSAYRLADGVKPHWVLNDIEFSLSVSQKLFQSERCSRLGSQEPKHSAPEKQNDSVIARIVAFGMQDVLHQASSPPPTAFPAAGPDDSGDQLLREIQIIGRMPVRALCPPSLDLVWTAGLSVMLKIASRSCRFWLCLSRSLNSCSSRGSQRKSRKRFGPTRPPAPRRFQHSSLKAAHSIHRHKVLGFSRVACRNSFDARPRYTFPSLPCHPLGRHVCSCNSAGDPRLL